MRLLEELNERFKRHELKHTEAFQPSSVTTSTTQKRNFLIQEKHSLSAEELNAAHVVLQEPEERDSVNIAQRQISISAGTQSPG